MRDASASAAGVTFDDQDLVRRCGELIEAHVDGELVALHVENGTCYGFNGTATTIWGLIAEPRSIGELCRNLAAEYDVDRDTCRAEIAELLTELCNDGLVLVERRA